MPIASGLGFVDREHPPVNVVVRNTTPHSPLPLPFIPTPRERLTCCLLITTVVLGSLVTLSWFVITFEHS